MHANPDQHTRHIVAQNQLTVMCTTRYEHFSLTDNGRTDDPDSCSDYSTNLRVVQDYSTDTRVVQDSYSDYNADPRVVQ